MYIKKQDFAYLERISGTLDDVQRKRFIEILLKECSKASSRDASQIKVVGDEIFDEQGFEPGEFITKTMIKKAYKKAKKGGGIS